MKSILERRRRFAQELLREIEVLAFKGYANGVSNKLMKVERIILRIGDRTVYKLLAERFNALLKHSAKPMFPLPEEPTAKPPRVRA